MDYIALIGEFVAMIFAVTLFMRSRNSLSATLLSIEFVTIACIFLGLGASNRGDALGKIVVNTAMMALPIVFLHFLIVFLKEKGGIRLPSKFLYVLYAIIIIDILSKISFFISPIAYPVYIIRNIITLPFFLIGLLLILSFISFVLIVYRKVNEYISTITKTILFSSVISFFPFAFLSFFPLLVFQKAWIDPLYTGFMVLFFPMSFAYLIISKQLYDIDIVLRRLMLTTVIAIFPSISIVVLQSVIFKATEHMPQIVLSFVVTLIVISFVLYFLEYFTSKFEPVMFPRKHKLQKALRQISKNLGSITSFREMKEIILVDIVQTLQVYGGAIVFRYPEHVEIISEGDIDYDEVERVVKMEWYEEHPSYTCMEVNRHEEFSSYLVMTRKRTNTMLGLEDSQWLNLIISYLAVSLENIHLIRKLTLKMQDLAAQLPNEEAGQDLIWFRKLMFELQEKERVRIATDLHDTTMQDLFFLKKRFASFVDRLEPKKEISDQFRSIIEFIEIINTNLRQSCFDLHPHLLQEIGLIQTISKLVERESYESSFELEFNGQQAKAIESKDLDTKRHLFRMVQELINNAKKHSHASKVGIRLFVRGGMFTLDYQDNGVGFDSERTVVHEIGASGMGMEQIKSRTLYLNGSFKLDTARGQGVRIQITIPIREGLSA